MIEVNETFYVRSSHGTLEVDIQTGYVTRLVEDLSNETPNPLKKIVRFDLDGYKKYWKRSIEAGDDIDILNLGYWYQNYEEPAHEWRKEINQDDWTTRKK